MASSTSFGPRSSSAFLAGSDRSSSPENTPPVTNGDQKANRLAPEKVKRKGLLHAALIDYANNQPEVVHPRPSVLSNDDFTKDSMTASMERQIDELSKILTYRTSVGNSISRINDARFMR